MVVHLLNEYMAMMVAIIVKYHGHVNKFIGDGILAVFSDEMKARSREITRCGRCDAPPKS